MSCFPQSLGAQRSSTRQSGVHFWGLVALLFFMHHGSSSHGAGLLLFERVRIFVSKLVCYLLFILVLCTLQRLVLALFFACLHRDNSWLRAYREYKATAQHLL